MLELWHVMWLQSNTTSSYSANFTLQTDDTHPGVCWPCISRATVAQWTHASATVAIACCSVVQKTESMP